MCIVSVIAINGPMPRRKRQDNKYLCPSCGGTQTIVEVRQPSLPSFRGRLYTHSCEQHTDMVMRLCAIPVRRLRQGAFYLHCAACHVAVKTSKTLLVSAGKRPASPRDYEPLTPSAPQPGSPLIAAGPPPRALTASTTTRRASAGWAPRLAPVMEGSGKGAACLRGDDVFVMTAVS